MSENLGHATLVLDTDDRALNTGVNRAKGLADNLDGKFQKTGRNISASFSLAIITANQLIELGLKLIRGFSALAETADKFRRLDIMLTRVEGSSEAAGVQF